MKCELTIFKSIFDNKTNKKMEFSSWEEFVMLLKQLSGQPGYKPKKFEKKRGSSLITPAVFKNGTTRANANVIRWSGWCALDIDDVDSLEESLKVFEGYEYVCYSTASSTKEKPKFRIIIQLKRFVDAKQIRHFWYALNKEFNSLGDPQTKDLARMYYVPARYPNAYHFFIHNRGNALSPSSIMSKHKFIQSTNSMLDNLPPEFREKYEMFRKDKLKNTNFKWTGIDDCPFINKALLRDYFKLTGTGWYHKLFSIMCSIASIAIRNGYPISAQEISQLVREIDMRNGNHYENRPIEKESARALTWATLNNG
jgi:hypothetical protein